MSAAKTEIKTFEDQTVIAVTRFDRTVRDGKLQRVHQEDLCQALSTHPARKYQSDGGPSASQIADLLRSSIAGTAAEVDVWRFLDALVFNWLIAGSDAHAKNYSLLLAANQVRLAPLYDIASILPYDKSNGHKIKLAMKIGGEYKLHRADRRVAWERAADELKLDRTQVVERVAQLSLQTSDAFAQVAADENITQLDSDMPTRLVELVSTRSKRCTDTLG